MLELENIKALIASGEGFNLEFKQSIPSKAKEITEEVCAFANASGGVLILGVDDNNAIIGVSFDNTKRSKIQDALNQISPNLSCNIYTVKIDDKELVIIEVPSGENKPYVLSGAIYVRQGPNSQKLTTVEEMRDFFQQADKIYFDEAPCKEFDYEKNISKENLLEFRTLSGLSKSIANQQIFENLRLFTKDGYFKNGAVLFFANNPEYFFEKAVIRCVAFTGNDKRFIEDDKIISGPLYQQYKQSIVWLKRKLNLSYDIEGAGSQPRKEILEIPETVLKEAIINALAHRDYYEKGGRITIEVFDDRVEISNPGGLVSGIPKNEFGKRSLSRNPLIFGLFERIRMVEQIGSGIHRMRDLMSEANLALPVFNTEGVFTVSLKRPIDFTKWVDKWVDKLTENRIKILKEIHQNNKISKRELETKIGISATAIDNNLNFLKNINLLERQGTAKTGYWKIHYTLP